MDFEQIKYILNQPAAWLRQSPTRRALPPPRREAAFRPIAQARNARMRSPPA
jgi:hypothetical protein